MSKIFVTGATGFLGGHTVAELARRGHEVVALVRDLESGIEPAREANGHGGAISVHPGDVLDPATFAGALAGCDAVFHCAGMVSRDARDADRLHRLHVEGTKNVLTAARAAGVKRAVVASTSGVVAVSDDPKKVRDESAPAPLDIIGTWPYYRSKLFAEQKAFELRQPGFEVVAVNPTLLLGPGDLRGSSTKDVEDILEGRVLAIPEGGMSFVDARDAAAGMVLAWERGKDGERYLLSAQNLTVRAFAEKISRIAGVSLPAMRMPRSRALATLTADVLGRVRRHTDVVPKLDRITLEMAQFFWYVDASRAQRELGWSHRDPMATLTDTIDDLTRRGVVWPRPARGD